MTTNQTIYGVPRKSLEQALKLAAVLDDGGDGADAESARGVVWILRALLDAPAVSLADEGEMPAAQPQDVPVAFTAVGVLRDDGDGVEPEWILEGGTAELWAGAMLLIADEDQELCAEDGHCELYRVPAEQPAQVAVVMPERKHVPDFTQHPMLYKEYTGWNACLDEIARLNTK